MCPRGLYLPCASTLKALLTHFTGLCPLMATLLQVTHLYTFPLQIYHKPLKDRECVFYFNLYSLPVQQTCKYDVWMGDQASAPRRCLINTDRLKGFTDSFPTDSGAQQASRLWALFTHNMPFILAVYKLITHLPASEFTCKDTNFTRTKSFPCIILDI